MTDAILVNGITPEKLTETILNGVRNQLNELKKEFTPKEPDEKMTPKDVSLEYKISLTTVFDWSNKGILKRRKIGNRTYYLRSEIEETLLNSNK
jgi:hypothetical protein